MKGCKMKFDFFSILTKNDEVKISLSPIKVKFKCKFCQQINTGIVGHITKNNSVDFDMTNNHTDAVWRLDCQFCDKKNDIHFIVKHYEETENNGKAN